MTGIAEYKPLQGNELWSDEFAMQDSISPHWSRTDSGTSGNASWQHGAGWLTARHTATSCGSSGYAHWLTLNLSDIGVTPSTGFTMETYTRVMCRKDVNYFMSFMGFADGESVGSGNQMWAMSHSSLDYHADVHGLRDWSGYNSQVSYTNLAYFINHGAGFYTRLYYEAANTFRLRVSQNGIHWLSSGTFANTMTPTHIGIGISNWNTGYPGSVGWKYVRLYDSNASFDPFDTL